MKHSEFLEGLARLNRQWKNLIGDERQAVLLAKWESLPDGIFSKAVDALIYQGGFAPAGDRIDAAVENARAESNRVIFTSPRSVSGKGCYACQNYGYVQVFDPAGTGIIAACECALGRSYAQAERFPDLDRALEFGYTRVKRPPSYQAKKHPDWKDADAKKYSPKLIGLYNTVQRAMLTNKTHGMRGISIVLKIMSDEILKVYDLMVAGNTTDSLIQKFNNAFFDKSEFAVRGT